MANTFRTFTDTAVGTSAATIYTVPSATATTIIGLNISNILTVGITVDTVWRARWSFEGDTV